MRRENDALGRSFQSSFQETTPRCVKEPTGWNSSGRCHSVESSALALKRPLLLAALVAPLLLTAAPRSFLAHDAGYYALQARWIEQSGQWLAPLWFGQPLFDRCIGAQWLMALSLKLFGQLPWAEAVPALLAAIASLLLTGWLARRLLPETASIALLAPGLLALTPLWINHAHLATQDMPLLAVELAGFCALVASQREGRACWPLLAGLMPGIAFLIKGFMVVLPVLAIAPYLLLERRWVLQRSSFWLGFALGWVPVGLWLSLSIQSFGLPVVAGLWTKLLFLSEADVYAAGPLYYLWNLPANTAPWSLAALAGWPRLWRSRLERGPRLALLLYPLLLLLLLSAFRTKTPYYGLQLTPWIAIAAAAGLQHWSEAARGWARRMDGWIAGAGSVALAAVLLLMWPASPLRTALQGVEGLPALPALLLAAVALGVGWLLVPLQPSPRRRVGALLLGPWLALVVLTQAGLFTDRSPSVRLALATPAAQTALGQGAVQAAAADPLDGADHAQLILLALATPHAPTSLMRPTALSPGQRVWIRRQELGNPNRWGLVVQAPALGDWVLAERLDETAGLTP